MKNVKTLKVGGHVLKPKTSFQISLDIARLPSRTPIEIPVFVSSGSVIQPVLLLLAGLHGDEVNGVEIVRSLLDKGLNHPQKGTTICIPILNIFGFLAYSRQVPDGKDVNRSFPGSANGSLASRIAYKLRTEILPVVDFGIDFHTGGASRSNYPQVRCYFGDKKSLALAEAFSAPLIVGSNLIPKSLRYTSAEMKIPMLVYEGGEALRHDEYATTIGIRGTRRVMKSLGMIRSQHKPKKVPKVIVKRKWIRARNSGMFHLKIDNGSTITKGQILGFITDPFADFKITINAPQDAVVIGVNNNPIVNQGDALINLGFTDSNSEA
ncbi:MAG: succinylglutamate desuccinylase [Cyclobacteriaceae bacterium]|nr:MAG: succinylglutamate desuccinylase [Cyclobacteriaceae bacterium]